jgi:Coenzyme PQQ synthesis protein D (PqqD)
MQIRKTPLRTVVNRDGAAILDVERGQICTLNSTAGTIWCAIEQGTTLDAIVSQISQETGTQLEVVERDVIQFMESLKQYRLWPSQ